VVTNEIVIKSSHESLASSAILQRNKQIGEIMSANETNASNLNNCIAQSKRLMDEIIRQNPIHVRFSNPSVADERPALAVFAGTVASDNFRECMKRAKTR
jgi:hypothetical protein